MDMTPEEFEDYLFNLTPEQYDALMEERIAKLNPEQQVICKAREVWRKESYKLIDSLDVNDPTSVANEKTLQAIGMMSGGNSLHCEHGRPYAKPCIACGKIYGALFPEVYDEDGFRLDKCE
jgi:hypothetical protein